MKLSAIMIFALMVGFPIASMGGLAPDADTDGVPDVIDTCSTTPSAGDCDSDTDGYGNACDADYNSDFLHTGGDITPFIALVGSASPAADQNCDLITSGGDIAPFISTLGASSAPGPSGLGCAGVPPCL